MALTTWNPLDKNSWITLSSGNLTGTSMNEGNYGQVRATTSKSEGIYQWEVTIQGSAIDSMAIGVVTIDAPFNSSQFWGWGVDEWSYLSNDGTLRHNGASTAYGTALNVGDVLGMVLNMDAQTLAFYKNGVALGVAFTSLPDALYPAISIIGNPSEGQARVNFGATTFAYPIAGASPYDGLPPGTFDLTSPANGATGRGLVGTLRWDESSDADTYDVYLDENNPPTTLVSDGQSGTSYYYSGLDESQTYYWKVVAHNDLGNQQCNDIFSFQTVLPDAPGSFALYYPADGAQNQPVTGTLTWGESLNATGYDVYLDQNNPPTTKVSSNQAATSYGYGNTTPLTQNRTYYWKVVAKNSVGSQACNANFSFKTYLSTPGTGKIYEFAGNTGTYRPYSYLSKRHKYRKTVLTCGRVLAQTYPVTLNIIFPGILTVTRAITDDRPFRFPGPLSEEVEIRISGIGTVYGVFLAGALEELPT